MSLHSIDKNTPIFAPAFEYEETTMQVPCGYASILSQLQEGLICAFEAIVYLDLNRMSTWVNGMTHWISASKLARVYKMSLRWVREVLYERLEKVATRIKIGRKGSRYALKHHDCPAEAVPLDRYGAPKAFAVSLGEGGPFDRLYKGDISWRACLIWIVLKHYSEWDPKKENCGQTDPMTMKTLSEYVRLTKKHVCDAIKELQEAGMLKRLTKRWEISIFQLYPKPRPKGQAEHVQEKSERSKGSPGMSQDAPHLDGIYWYSYNRFVRCRIEDLQFETRKRGSKLWIPTAREKVLRRKGGKAIVRDLEEWCLMSNGVHPPRKGGFHTAGGGSATAKDGFATASRPQTGA